MGAVINPVIGVNTNLTHNPATGSYNISPSANMQAGSDIAIGFTCSIDPANPTLKCTDTQGNTYLLYGNTADTSTQGSQRFMWFYCANPTPLTTSDVVTVSNNYAALWDGLLFFEVAGVTGSVLDSKGAWQQNITGSSANNLSTPNMAGGSVSNFVIAVSMGTTSNGTAPYYPSVGTGLTLGGQWFNDGGHGGANIAIWATGTFQAPGNFPALFTSPSGASGDNFVTVALTIQSQSNLLTGPAVATTSATGALTNGIAPAGAAGGKATATGSLTTNTPSGLGLGAFAATHLAANGTVVGTTPINTQGSGSGFVVGLLCGSPMPAAVYDSNGNQYIQIGAAQEFTEFPASWNFSQAGVTFDNPAYLMDGTYGGYATLWYCPLGVGGAGHSVAIDASQNNAGDMVLFFQEITNAAGGGIMLDASAGAQSTNSPFATPAITTTRANEVVVALFGGASTQNPATIALGGSSGLRLGAQSLNGSVGFPMGGALAAGVFGSIASGYSTTFTQAGNTVNAGLLVASFYAGAISSLAGAASAPTAALGALSTGAGFAGAATSVTSASGAVVQFATITLTSEPSPNTIGTVYDPYWWEDSQPFVGAVIKYDPSNLVILPNGTMIFTAPNVSAVVQFIDAQGVLAQGVVTLSSGPVGYALVTTAASGALTTRPNVYWQGPASGVASSTGSLTTGISVTAAGSSIASAAGTVVTGLTLAGAGLAVVEANPIPLGPIVQFFNPSPAAAVASASGAVTLRQTFSGPAAVATTSASGAMSHGASAVGGAGATARASGALSTATGFAGAARGLGGALGALLTKIAVSGASAAVSAGVASLYARATYTPGIARGIATAAGSLATGAGFIGASRGHASAGGALTVGAGLKGFAAAVGRAAGTALTTQTQFQGAAFALVVADPYLSQLTTRQSPTGLYAGNPDLVIGERYFNTPTFNVFGPTDANVLTFDYSETLPPGVTLTGVAEITVSCTAGADPTPMDVVSGLASFDPTMTQVLLPVNAANGIVGCDYYIIISCATTNPEINLDRFALMQIRQ